MKINNLQQVLEEANLTELPKRNDNATFKYAIGLVSTTACDESYCLLNMYENKPNVRKIYIGGLIKTILAVFPYEVEKNDTIITNNVNGSQIEQKAAQTPILHDNNSQELKDAQKEAQGEEYGGEWGVKSVNNPAQARKWLRAMADRGYPALRGKALIKDEARLKEEFLKIVEDSKKF